MVTVIQILNQYVFGLQPECATIACDGSGASTEDVNVFKVRNSPVFMESCLISF